MKITDVKTAVVMGNYEWTLVRIFTDTGLYGTGEAFFGPAIADVIRAFRPILVGEDPRDVDRLWDKMKWAAAAGSSGGGLAFNAISGLEAALWDLVGKHLGLPLYQLLGGRFREEVRIYCDCHAGEALEAMDQVLIPFVPDWAREDGEEAGTEDEGARHPIHGRAYASDEESYFTPEEYAARARDVAEDGYTALKFDLDVPNPYTREQAAGTITTREIEYMESLVAAVRQAVGPDVDLAFDCHWRYNTADVLKLAWALEPYHLLWLEDPTPPENWQPQAYVTQQTRTPIASGENLYLRHGFREILENGGLDIIAPDLQKVGGLLESRKIADMADTYYMNVAPHNISSPIGTMASAHVCAAIPNFIALEYHAREVPFWNDLVDAEEPLIQDGRIRVPQTPGIGVELNEDVARRYAKPGEPFFA